MGLFSSDNPKEQRHSGIVGSLSVDLIKWEPEDSNAASLVVHKFEYEDFPTGSYLIVGASQLAVFTNNLATGSSLDESAGKSQYSIFSGPCKIKLETGDARFAPFRNMSHALSGGASSFHSTVYFINTTYMNELPWGTQKPIVMQDPEEEVNIHVRANGLFGVHIEQQDTTIAVPWARTFMQKVVGTRANYTQAELLNFMRAKIIEYAPDMISKKMLGEKIGILAINSHLTEFSDELFTKLKPYFADFGLVLDNFSCTSINAPDDDLDAVNEMKIQRKRNELEAQGNAKKMDIESAARARMREREGYTYQQEQGFNVMQAAAENEGMSSTFMGAGMGLGMGTMVGAGMGSSMGAIAQHTMQATNFATPQTAQSTTCPSCQAPCSAQSKFCASCGKPIEQAAALGAICAQCGATLAPSAKFCSNCGCAAPQQTTCSTCGATLAPGSKFCMQCGAKC